MSTSRANHSATLLNDGTVLVTGGLGWQDRAAELFDPAEGTFRPTVGMTMDRALGHTATLLDDGTVLVTGSTNSGSAVTSAEIYYP